MNSDASSDREIQDSNGTSALGTSSSARSNRAQIRVLEFSHRVMALELTPAEMNRRHVPGCFPFCLADPPPRKPRKTRLADRDGLGRRKEISTLNSEKIHNASRTEPADEL